MVETSKYALFTVGTNSTQEAYFKVDDGMGTTGGTSVGGTLSIGAPYASANVSLVAFGSASNINLNLVPKGSGTTVASGPFQASSGVISGVISTLAGTSLVLAPGGTGTLAVNSANLTLLGLGSLASITALGTMDLALVPGSGQGLLLLPIPGTATTAASFTATKRLQIRDSTGTTWYIPANGTAW